MLRRKQPDVETFLRGHRSSQMKQANNNEVDLLLRSLARGRNATAGQSGSERGDAARVSSDHLDADELNSYAEGVAPTPARVRYTEHLADCEACRSIVVGLIQASGAANRFAAHDPERGPQREHQGGTTFWQKLSLLFSPPVLRYAVPALVLTAVIGIGLLALKQQRGSELVARNETQTNAPNSTPGAGGSQGAISAATKPTPGSPPGISGAAPSPVSADSGRDKLILQEEKSRPGEVPPLSEGSVSVSKAAAAKDSSQPADAASVAESRPYAQEPKPRAVAPPAPLLDAEKTNELAKEQAAKREDRNRDEDDAYRAQSDGVHGPSRSQNNTVFSENARRGVGNVAGGRGPSGTDKKKTAEEETRTVMGRHFSREGDAWVDTAYESSRTTARVARGSDQFRALVADEPGIRTISEQLNGVVIVVWKGRAYRIQ